MALGDVVNITNLELGNMYNCECAYCLFAKIRLNRTKYLRDRCL